MVACVAFHFYASTCKSFFLREIARYYMRSWLFLNKILWSSFLGRTYRSTSFYGCIVFHSRFLNQFPSDRNLGWFQLMISNHTTTTITHCIVHFCALVPKYLENKFLEMIQKDCNATRETASSPTFSTNSVHSLSIFLVFATVDENNMSFLLLSLYVRVKMNMFISHLHFFVKRVAHFSTGLFISLLP